LANINSYSLPIDIVQVACIEKDIELTKEILELKKLLHALISLQSLELSYSTDVPTIEQIKSLKNSGLNSVQIARILNRTDGYVRSELSRIKKR
jgi:uncharacterized protein YerC